MNEDIYQQIQDLQKDVEQKRENILALRKQLELEPVSDYTLKNHEGNDVLLSSLFDDRDELLIIHNMGKGCSYCTLWADGFNGFSLPLADRMPFVVISPDEPKVQKEFAESRGWKFKMLSAHDSTFIKDMGFEREPRKFWPGTSALIRKEGKIYRTSYDFFGPGDPYCSVWHFFDLFPKGVNDWKPKFNYA
ncbi:MAG: hypothetical protein JWO06_3065 [Bacteroidota bacterium]|nr:hypothetical protein [Bacteroidota bacterium]